MIPIGGHTTSNLVTAVEGLTNERRFEMIKLDLVQFFGRSNQVSVTLRRTNILIQLQPQISKRVGAVVSVSDTFTAEKFLRVIVDANIDVVVDLLLPILVAWCTRRGPVRIGRWQKFVQLTELIFLLVFVIRLRGC